MKKIFSIFLCVLLMSTQFTPSLAENTETILGLNENLNRLILSNSNNTSIVATISDSYASFMEKQINTIMSAPEYAREKIGLSGDYDNQVNQIRDMYALDIGHSFLINDVVGNQYAKTYADADVFNYLLTGSQYWLVPLKSGKSYKFFDIQGNYLEKEPMKMPTVKLTNFIFDFSKISTLLKESNINNIDDIKVVMFDKYGSLIYVRDDLDEYIYRFTSLNNDYEMLQNQYFKSNVFCNAKEAINGLVNIGNTDGYVQFKVDEEKNIFSNEATALQNDGLLNGNEKGLDLLKPLTRIEAATILLRAIGSTDTVSDSNIQTFSDVPQTYWGYAAAESAADKGIVYGVGDGMFAPEKTVTSAEFATMVLRASGTNDFEWKEALNMLINQGILTEDNVKNMDMFTRGDMAKIIFEAKNKGLI